MASPVYWVGSNNDIYYGSGQQGAGVQNLGVAPPTMGIDNSPNNGYGITANYIDLPNFSGPATRIADPNPGGQVLGASTSSSSSSASNPGLAAYLQASGMQLGNLQNDYNAVGPAQDSAVAGINNAYTPQMNTLDAQLAQGHAANQAAQFNLDQNKAIALRDLGNQLRGMYNNYQNQIGVAGAGNSSAANLIGYGLTQEANNGRGDIGQQYGAQQTGINQNQSNLQTNYQNQKDALDAWKADQLNKIAVQYGQERQSIEDQMLSVGSDEARTALYMKDQAAANQALATMQQVVQTHGNALQNLNAQFSNVQHPNADLSQYDQGYQVQQFSPVQLAGMSYQSNAAPTQTTATGPIAANFQKNSNQTPGTLASLSQ